MATAKPNWQVLRERRKRVNVSQAELAARMGYGHQACHRRELPPDHPEHVEMSDADLLEWCAALQRIVEERTKQLTLAEVLDQ